MNLLEVLTVMKQYKQLNESYQSSILDKIFKSFENSNLTLDIVSLTKYAWDNIPKDIYDILRKYQLLAKENLLTQEMLDNPDNRQELLGIKFVKKPKDEKINAIEQILDSVILKTGSHLGISEITDTDLIFITPAEAKLKQYKSLLQFWFNYKNELVAICKDNTIICYISANYSFYDVNYDFKGDSTSKDIFYAEKTDENIEKQKEFINKAFKIIPEYNIAITNKEIKNKLGINNVKKLQSEPYISYVYAVNEEGMKKIDYKEISKNRLDYKEYLKTEKEKLEKITYGKYKNFNKLLVTKTSLIKDKKIPNEMLNNISNYVNVCFDVYNDMQDFMMKQLNNFDRSYAFSYKFSENLYDFNSMTSEYALLLKKLLPQNIEEYKFGRRRNQLYFKFRSIGDCFVVVNIFLEKLIYACSDLLNAIENFNNLKDDNINNIANLLHNLKEKYNKVLIIVSNYNNILVLRSAIHILADVNIDITSILNRLQTNMPKERYEL